MATKKSKKTFRNTAIKQGLDKQTSEDIRRDRERQKEISKYIHNWLNPRKHRTIPLLEKKTHISATSLREYLSGETNPSPHRAMAIVAVCCPGELIEFIEKFLPEIYPPILESMDARAKKMLHESQLIDKITKTVFAEANISKSPIIQEMVSAVKLAFGDGLVIGSGKNISLMGGLTAGIIIKIGNSTFDRIAKILLEGETVKVGGEDYKLRAFDASYRVITLEKIESRGWIFLCADQCKFFDETTRVSLKNHLNANAEVKQRLDRSMQT